jgi:hypothetical protein
VAKKKKIEEKAQQPRGYNDTFELSGMELEELSARIQADMIQAETDKEPWNQERLKDIRAYFGIKKASDWPFKGAAKVSSQLHRIMVDTMKANIVASATAPEKPIAVGANNAQSLEEAKYVSDLHNSLAVNEYKLGDVLDRGLHTAFIESFVVLKPAYVLQTIEIATTVRRWLPKDYNVEGVSYDLETDTVTDDQGNVIPSTTPDTVGGDVEELKKVGLHECTFEVTKEKVVQDGVKVYVVNGTHVYLPIWAPGETPYEKYQRAPFVIHQEFPTLQELELLEADGRVSNVEAVRTHYALKQLATTQQGTAELLKDEKYKQAGSNTFGALDTQLAEVLWWYGKFKYKGKLREIIACVHRDSGTVLKLQVNQFGIRPFFPIVPFPVDETPFGESLPKQIRALVTEIELAMNTILNMGMIKAYPPKFYDPSSGFDPKTLGNFGPNSYIPVRDPSRNVFMPPMPEDPRILFEMIKMLMDLVERTTANSDAVQGQVSPTANTTAFEVQQSLVRAGVRFDIIYKRLREQLAPMFGFIHELLKRYMPYEKEIRLMGELALEQGQSKLLMITRGQINGEFSFSLSGNSITQEQAQLQKDQQMYSLFRDDPYISFKPESAYYLRYPLVQHYNSKLVEKILPTPEEVQQLLRDRQQVQNEQEALTAMMMDPGAMNGMGQPSEVPTDAGQEPPTGGA